MGHPHGSDGHTELLALYSALCMLFRFKNCRVLGYSSDMVQFWLFYRIADAEENLGESEVREAHLAKSLFYIRIGDKVINNDFLLFFVTVVLFHLFSFWLLIHPSPFEPG